MIAACVVTGESASVFGQSTLPMAGRSTNPPTINGTVTGSLQQMIGQGFSLNSGAVVTGDWSVPGTPNVNQNGSPNFSGIQLGSGSTTPTGYTITLNSGSQLRYLIERTNPVCFTAVPNPPAPTGTRDVTVNAGNVAAQIGAWSTVHSVTLNSNAGSVVVPAGSYGTFTANAGDTFALGTSGATVPSTYSFDALTLNSSSNLVVNGPVVIQVKNGVAVNSGCVLGNAQNPAWVALKIASGGLTINSYGTAYGFVEAPTGTVNLSGKLTGSVISANSLSVNSGGSITGQTATTTSSPPSVMLTSPVGGQVVQGYAATTIQASATAAQGAIARVDFYANGGSGAVKIGTSTTSPYTITWNGGPPGTYSLTAVATDSAGLSTTSAAVTLYVNFPPSLTTSTSANVVAAGGTLTIRSGAGDSDGSIALVQFYANGQLIGQSTAVPYAFAWNKIAAGRYAVTVRATDNEGGVTTSAPLDVTSDAPPSVALTAPLEGAQVQNPANITLTATAAASATGTSIAKVDFYANDGSGPTLIGTTTTAPATFVWNRPAAGTYAVTAVATDNLGISATSAPVHLKVFGWTTLTEGNQFLSQTFVPVTIPNAPQTLAVAFRGLSFDATAQRLIKDGFELALLGPDGKTLVPVIASGRDAFYNAGEASPAAQAAGVASSTADGVTTVFVDLSRVAPGAKATLVARLLNDDTDTATTVQVAALVPTNVAGPAAAPTVPPVEKPPTSPVRFAGLEDLSASFAPVYGQTAYNASTQTLFAGLALQNVTPSPVQAPLVAVIDRIGDAQVEVANPDGYTADGLPYFDYSNALGGTLAPGAASGLRTIAFADGDGKPFTYRLRLFAAPNHAPVWTTAPVTQTGTGQSYFYAAHATDPDGDTLIYALAAGPAGMTVDAASGLVTWTGTDAVGTQAVTLQVSDGRGGTATQTYALQIVAGQGTLPPRFTSTPVVDATFGTAYSYALAASDPQGYPLAFALGSGPVGMTVAGSTLTWTPGGTATGPQSVTVTANDGHGGTAAQSFTINLHAAAGDIPPAFDSTPLTAYTLGHGTPVPYTYPAHALGGGGSALLYSLLGGPSGAMIDPASGVVTWTPNAPGAYPFRIAVNDRHGGSVEQDYTVTVTAAANHPPVVVGAPITQVVPGQDYQYGVQATDADGDPLTYTLTSGPSGLSIDAATGLIDWPTPVTLTGPTSVGVEVSDGFGGTAFQSFQITPVAAADGQIAGLKFDDLNGDGTQDTGEPGVPGVTMYLDLNGNGQWDPGEPKTVTGPDGSYVFRGVFAGTYTVREVLPAGSYQTQPGNNAASVTIGGSGRFTYTTTADFNGGQFVNATAATPLADAVQLADATKQRGSWNVIQDGQTAGRTWGQIVWNNEAAGLDAPGVAVQARAADDRTALASQSYVAVTNGAPVGLQGRYLDVLVTLALAGPLPTDDPAAQFSTASNPNGVWSYGWSSSLGGPFNYDFASGNAWLAGVSGGGNPGIYFNPASTEYIDSSARIDPLSISMHPGNGGEYSVLRWTASSAGTYAVGDLFKGQDVVGTSTDDHLLLDGVSLFDTYTSGYLNTHTFAGTLNLNAGDTLDLTVGNGGNGYYYDTTGIQESIANLTGVALPILSDLTIYSLDRETTDFGNVSPASDGGDLVAQSLDLTGVAYDAQGLTVSGTIKAQIANVGSGTIAGSFQVVFFEDVNGDRTYVPGVDRLLGTATVHGVLPAGQSLPAQALVSGRVSFAGAPLGVYVDSTNLVAETNEANNFLGSVASGSPPDLLPSAIRATGGNGASATYTVRIGNRGGTPAPAGVSVAFYNGNPLGGGTFLGAVPTTQILNTGQFQDVSLNLYNGANVDLWIAADDDGATPGALHGTVTESDETNNAIHLAAALVQSNEPPHFVSTPATLAASGATYRYAAQAADPNHDPLTYKLAGGPVGMVVDPATGFVLWSPTAAQEGTAQVTLQVSDGRGGSDLQSFQVNVAGAENAPVIVSVPTTQAVAGYPYEYDVRAQDAAHDAITYRIATVLQGTSGNFSFDATLGRLIYHPTSAEIGSQTVTVLAVNAQGQMASQTYTLTVVAQATNRPPVIASAPAATVRLGQTYTYVVQATDPDGDPLTLTLTQAPAGMTLVNGYVSWIPTAAQYGPNAVNLTVSDGRGGMATQSFMVNVVSATTNHPPVIASSPFLAAAVGTTYAYNLVATDADNDTLGYSLLQAPPGMSIDPLTGTLRWTPQLFDLGTAPVTVQVVDGHGGLVTQSFTLTVRGAVLPPAITSNPVTAASINYDYAYAVQATDPQGAPLTYALNNPPPGLTIDPVSGLIAWTPTVAQAGPVPVEVQVQDGMGGTAVQDFTVQVSTQPPVLLPQITSAPALNLSPGDAYRFQVVVADPNPAAGALIYSLVHAPPGMTIDSATGLISWTSTASAALGIDPIVVQVRDAAGGTAILSYNLTVAVSYPPTIDSTPPATVAVGEVYHYQLAATDPQGASLSYAVTQGPPGMTIDAIGVVNWTAPATPASFPVTLQATNSRGKSVPQTFTLAVVADNQPPTVTLVQTTNVINIGQSVGFQVFAADNVAVAAIKLTVAGVPVGLDANNIATVPFPSGGVFAAVATATDPAGNTAAASVSVRVLDPTDNHFPTVTVDETNLRAVNGIISQPTPLVATVQDSSLQSYEVDLIPADQVDPSNVAAPNAAYRVLATGTSNRNDATVATLDPTVLANGSYFVRILATNTNGNTNAQGVIVTVSGQLKLGRFFYSTTDLKVPLAGIPIQITRTYDSLAAGQSGDFGYGWSLGGIEARVQISVPAPPGGVPNFFASQGYSFRVGSTVTITGPDGKRENFIFSPQPANLGIPGLPAGYGLFGETLSPAFRPEQGVYDRLVPDDQTLLSVHGDGSVGSYLIGTAYYPTSFHLTTRDGHVYHYTVADGLVDERDRNGVSLTFDHLGISSSTGASIVYARDPVTDRIIGITDPSGGQIAYAYDANGNLKSETDQAGRKTQYTYLTTPAHYLNTLVDADGQPVATTAYDVSGRLSTVADPLGHVTTFLYDPVALTQTKIEPVDPATGQSPQVVTQYDARGNVTQVTNEVGNVSTTTFDANNNPLVTTAPNGDQTLSTYDAQGNLLTRTDPLGQVTASTYNANNERTSVTDPLGRTTGYQYDADGRLIEIVDALGQATQLGHDDLGRIVALTDPLGRTTQLAYTDDPATGLTGDKPTTVTWPDGATLQFTYDIFGSATSATDENGHTIRLLTDSGGFLQTRTEADGTTTGYGYDANGNLASVTDALGQVTKMKYDAAFHLIERDGPNGEVTKFRYDQLGRLSAKIDPLGRTTTRHYRADGVLASLTQPDGTAIVFDVDGNGRRTGVTDPLGNHTRWVYDGNSRVLAETDPLGKVTRYAYDAAGNLVRIVDRLNRVRQFAYDADNRPTTETWLASPAALSALKTISTSYDALGNVTGMADDTGTLAMQYDGRNRLQTSTASYNGQAPFLLDYAYDPGGRVTRLTDGDGVSVATTYDARDQIARLVWQGSGLAARADFSRDAVNELTAIKRYADADGSHPVGQSTYAYTRNLPNFGYQALLYNEGSDTTPTADFARAEAFGPLQNDAGDAQVTADATSAYARLGGIAQADGSGNSLFAETYLNDSAGQLSRKTVGADTTTFSYDATGELTGAVHSAAASQNETYAYDVGGNRTATANSSVANTIAPGNRIAADASSTYSYDDEGHLVRQTDSATGHVWNFAYDLRQRLTSAVQTDGTGDTLMQATYVYDALDRRIAKIVNGTTTRFFYNGDNLWKQSGPAGTRRYLAGSNLDEWIAGWTSGGVSWYLRDRLGSIVGTTDANGTPTQTYAYDSYGNTLGVASNSDRLGFTGREYDAETGLYYLRARYYNSAMGRFLTEDPLGARPILAPQRPVEKGGFAPRPFAAGDFNLSRYVGNDPLGTTDRSGEIAIIDYRLVMATPVFVTADGFGARVIIESTEGKTFVFDILDRPAYLVSKLTLKILNYYGIPP